MSHGSGSSRVLGVEGISRVEGEGSLTVEIEGDHVSRVALEIFEPPRYFEALLRGRSYSEAPDLTSRICGICPVAYQLTACSAVEDACETDAGELVTALRRLLYCGEWLQSHALHVYLLHAPDFLGCEDAVELAQMDRGAVERGLRLKKCGNLLMETVGGRAVHPVNVRVGGFYRAPDIAAIAALAEPLKQARQDALDTVSWVAGFDIPDLQRDYRFVSLAGDGRYPIDAGQITIAANPTAISEPVSTSGPTAASGQPDRSQTVSPSEFAEMVVEEHVQRSTALHARLHGRDIYLTGPLARYSNNFALLPELARDAALGAGLGPECRNPFQSVIVRAVEMVFACDEALRLVNHYEPPSPAAVEVRPRASQGTGATEAPRGLLFHTYQLEGDGSISNARIVPPTSQNQLAMEADLLEVARAGIDLSDHDLTHRCERSIRNHDPCISCAAHFLDLRVTRR